MTSRILALSVVLAAMVAGCAGAPPENPRLADLRRQVDTARADPNIARFAPAQLQDAQQSLKSAEQAARDGDQVALDHDLYVGQKSLAAAEYQAKALGAREQALAGPGPAVTDVPFASGQAALTPGAMNRLQSLANYLKARPQIHATVQGFTDDTGNAAGNQQLSQARAQAVKDYLVGQGIAPTRITTRGLGEGYPLASNATPTGRGENRRAEVQLSQLPQ